jgi:hypothetical protein
LQRLCHAGDGNGGKQKILRKSELWSQDFTAELFCNVGSKRVKRLSLGDGGVTQFGKNMPAHKNRSIGFGDESFSEQAKTINQAIANLGKMIEAHILRSDADGRHPVVRVRQKCVNQLQRLLVRVERVEGR